MNTRTRFWPYARVDGRASCSRDISLPWRLPCFWGRRVAGGRLVVACGPRWLQWMDRRRGRRMWVDHLLAPPI